MSPEVDIPPLPCPWAVWERWPFMTVVQWDRVGKGNLKENLEPSKGLEGNLKEICREKSFDVAQRLSSRCAGCVAASMARGACASACSFQSRLLAPELTRVDPFGSTLGQLYCFPGQNWTPTWAKCRPPPRGTARSAQRAPWEEGWTKSLCQL